MGTITNIFINPRTKDLVSEEFKFEFVTTKNIKAKGYEKINGDWNAFPLYVMLAIGEKQRKTKYQNLQIGIFTTTSLIDDKDFSTLLDLVLETWSFYLHSEKILRDSLLRELPIDFESIEKSKIKKNLSIIPTGKLSAQNCSLISQGLKLLKNNKNRRLKIALHRFSASYKRADPLDSILDCCSCLEALYNLSTELRLKIALISFHLVTKNKKNTLEKIYEMYGKRNDFIHGNKIPEVTSEQAKEYINQTAKILIAILKIRKIPTTEELTNQIFKYYN